MSLPDEINVSITIHGLSFDLRVRGLKPNSEYLFPSSGCADVFVESSCLRLEAVQAAACALDAAALKFREGFEASLSKVLSKAIEVNKGAA